MKKKVVAVCATVALAAVAFGGATLAYFTDTDQVKNNFTIGDIDIDLYEYTDLDGNGKLEERKFQEYLNYSNIMPGDEMAKVPVIENESDTNAAYVRVAVVMNNYEKINKAIDGVYECKGGDHSDCKKIDGHCYTDEDMNALYDSVFEGWGIEYTKDPIRGSMSKRADKIDSTLLGIDYVRGVSGQYQSGSNGTNYMEGFYYGAADGRYYEDAYLEGGRLYVFYLKLDAGKTYELFQGLNAPADFTEDQMAMFQNLEIGIYADAIQVDNFENAKDAFNALEEAHPLGWWNN